VRAASTQAAGRSSTSTARAAPTWHQLALLEVAHQGRLDDVRAVPQLHKGRDVGQQRPLHLASSVLRHDSAGAGAGAGQQRVAACCSVLRRWAQAILTGPKLDVRALMDLLAVDSEGHKQTHKTAGAANTTTALKPSYVELEPSATPPHPTSTAACPHLNSWNLRRNLVVTGLPLVRLSWSSRLSLSTASSARRGSRAASSASWSRCSCGRGWGVWGGEGLM
jgi:hypothetical protein